MMEVGGRWRDAGQAAVCGRRKAYSRHIFELHSGPGFCLGLCGLSGAGHTAPLGLWMLRLWSGRLKKVLTFIL